jgi:uncharacterized membrane protein YkvA (DUF1232 family)
MRWFYWILILLYLISPYDLIPDLIPGWGWADDLLLIGGLCWYFLVYRRRGSGPDRAGEGTRKKAAAEESSSKDAIKDPYAVLGLDRSASEEEIKRAYRQLAAKYHPDKVSHLGEEFRELAAKRFKEIKAAFDALNGSA